MAETRQNPPDEEHAVLLLPELLEKTLIELDNKTLLLSQRVNKFCSNVIGNSTLLQKKLFFLPTTLDEAVALTMPYKIPTYREFSDVTLFTRRVWIEEEIGAIFKEMKSRITLLNPLLFNQSPEFYSDQRVCRLKQLVDRTDSSLASWQRMHFAHPGSRRLIFMAKPAAPINPERELILIGVCATDRDPLGTEYDLSYKRGEGLPPLTIGETLQAIKEELMSTADYPLSSNLTDFFTTTKAISAEEYEARKKSSEIASAGSGA